MQPNIPNESKMAGRVVSVLGLLLSMGCCLCTLPNFLMMMTPSADLPPLVMPDGQEIPADLFADAIGFNVVLFATAAVSIFVLSLGIWYFFGRETSPANRRAKFATAGLLTMGFGCGAMSIILGFTSSIAVQSVEPTLPPTAMLPSILIFCCFPSSILVLIGGGIWLFYIRPKKSPSSTNDKAARVTAPSPTTIDHDPYEQFLRTQLADPNLWFDKSIQYLVQQRTLAVLSSFHTAEPKKHIVRRLYSEQLITGDSIVDLAGADLSGLDFANERWVGINLSGVDLRFTNFQNANLHAANLQNAYLQGADLRACNLMNSNLENANLEGAKLHNAKLNNAVLSDAVFSDANLWRADLSHTNVTQAQLGAARTVNEAILPQGVSGHANGIDETKA